MQLVLTKIKKRSANAYRSDMVAQAHSHIIAIDSTHASTCTKRIKHPHHGLFTNIPI
jgi:hypothetical protein